MSMNLHAEDEKGRSVKLWQTPSLITRIALNTVDGERQWEDTRFIYLEWVMSNLDGVWEMEERICMRDRIIEHVEEINSYDKLDFFAL